MTNDDSRMTTYLSNQFHVKNLSTLWYFFSLEVVHSPKGLSLSRESILSAF